MHENSTDELSSEAGQPSLDSRSSERSEEAKFAPENPKSGTSLKQRTAHGRGRLMRAKALIDAALRVWELKNLPRSF
jgi:hypothetical protein